MVEFGFKYSVPSVGFGQPGGSYLAVDVLSLPLYYLQMNLFFDDGMDAFKQLISRWMDLGGRTDPFWLSSSHKLLLSSG